MTAATTASKKSHIDLVIAAMQQVESRLRRTSQLLETADVPHFLVGGNAVTAWIESVMPSGLMFSQNVDFMIQPEDRTRAIGALQEFQFQTTEHSWQILFRDPQQKWRRDSIRLLIACEEVGSNVLFPLPEMESPVYLDDVPCIPLFPLVAMKLAAYRTIDAVHLQNMSRVDLINADWLDRLPAGLKPRLERILENPDI